MLLAIWDDGVWQDAVTILVIVLVAYALVLWIAALVWTYRDIQARTRDSATQIISVCLVLLFNVPGLLLYLILRPKDTLSDLYDRQLEAEALLHEIREQATCPTCRRRIEDSFMACPFCRTTLRAPCDNCGSALASTWVLRPFCGADRVPTIAAASATQKLRAPTIPAPSPDTAPRPLPQRTRRASTATHTPPAQPASDPPVDAAVDAGSP
jgi:hypothetical protein